LATPFNDERPRLLIFVEPTSNVTVTPESVQLAASELEDDDESDDDESVDEPDDGNPSPPSSARASAGPHRIPRPMQLVSNHRCFPT